MRTIPIILLSFFLMGCGEATIDGSSKATMKSSMKQIVSQLGDSKRKAFGQAWANISMNSGLKVFGSKNATDKAFKEVRQKLDGMTADEIIAFSKLLAEQ